MNHVERFRAVMSFQSVDRLPMREWAMWWGKTIDCWQAEGLPARLTSDFDIAEYFGLDPYKQFWCSTTESTIEATKHRVEGIVSAMDEYLQVLPRLFPDHDYASSSPTCSVPAARSGNSRASTSGTEWWRRAMTAPGTSRSAPGARFFAVSVSTTASAAGVSALSSTSRTGPSRPSPSARRQTARSC